MCRAFKQLLLLNVVALVPLIAVGGPVLRIAEGDGKPIEQFEVMIHTADQGYENWQEGISGKFDLLGLRHRYSKSAAIDVVVRADGYASVVRSFQGAAKEELVANGAEIVLERARELRLMLRPAQGMELPKDVMPQVYFPELAWRVEVMWQPQNLRIQQPDFDMLNVQRKQDAAPEFVFRLPSEPREFLVAIYHPGWLRYYKVGPFTRADFNDDVLTLKIPRPGNIAGKLHWGDRDAAGLPFTRVNFELMRQLQAGGNSYLSVASEQSTLDKPSLSVADLAPGNYMMMIRTEPKQADDLVAGTEINPGRFFASKSFELQAGQSLSATFDFVPFDADANRGERTAHVKVTGADGSLAVGKQLKVNWFDGHYGAINIFDGPIPADGVVVLKGISDAVPTEAPFGPYSVEVGGESIGFFRVKAEDGMQEFAFRLVPKAGDMAPDMELAALDSAENVRLKDLRGKIVFLEFWETGCGPCQSPMARLNELVAALEGAWNDELAVLPVGLDANREIIASHVESRGWKNLRHYWSRRSEGEYFANARQAFVVHGVPTAVLIDQEGEIVWRGNPTEIDLAEEVAKLRAK